MATVADCERVQTEWFRLRSTTLDTGGWRDGPLEWLPDGQHLWLMFPRELPPDAVARGVDHARERGLLVGAWLNSEVDAAPLGSAGFERGWSPCWMAARLADVGPAGDPRITLQTDTTDYTGEHAGYRAELALARLDPPRAWYAAAHTAGGRLAGRAWSFRPDGAGEPAGVFDMAVWPRFQRAGLGTGLLRAVCAAAGATEVVLNATPEGRLLYQACGFGQLGEGITWWLHPPA